jgi:Asp-tRNA(Asn)/Glu-tRNA(Gln) amidotransferase C subunit
MMVEKNQVSNYPSPLNSKDINLSSSLSSEQVKAIKNLQQIHMQQRNPQFHYSTKFTQEQIDITAGKFNEILQVIMTTNNKDIVATSQEMILAATSANNNSRRMKIPESAPRHSRQDSFTVKNSENIIHHNNMPS